MDIIVLYFIGCLSVSLLMFVNKNALIDYLLFVPFFILQLIFNINCAIDYNNASHGTLVPFLNNEFFSFFTEYLFVSDFDSQYFETDGIGLLFLTLLTIISFFCIIHSIIYSSKSNHTLPEIEVYNGSLVLFIATMSGVLVAKHIGLMWAFLEATTLCASMLIFHNRDKSALEAAWKYIFVCSIAISLAFMGILVLGIALKGSTHVLDLTIAGLSKEVVIMDPIWLKVSFLLVLTGFSTKMGVIPMFTVDIDAKDVAPTPIGALLSGGLMNVGFVAILRFYQVFSYSGIQEWMNSVLLITGMASVLFGAVYITKVKNFKRMFAYSSVEHGGLVLIALASGKEGHFAMIFHLIMHALVKSSLFLQLGQVYRTYQSITYDRVGSYFKHNPVGAAVILVGLLCVTAMPPSGLFVSEFYIFKGLIYRGHWFYTSCVFLLLTIIMYYLSANVFKLLFSSNTSDLKLTDKIHPMESSSQILLLLVVLYFGITPPEELTDFINHIVKVIPNGKL